MKISVIIPVYNTGELVRDAVRSVFEQGVEDLELILVDDGSTDISAAVCDSLAAEDKRVKVLHQMNMGVSAARNAGLKQASGEYVMFMDSDDRLREGALAALEPSGCDLSVGGFAKISEDIEVKSYIPSAEGEFNGIFGMDGFFDAVLYPRHCYLVNSACFKLFRKDIIEKYSLRFLEGLDFAEDKLFVFSYLTHISSAKTVGRVVYDYIMQDGSLSSNMHSDRHISNIIKMLDAYCPVLEKLCAKYPESVRVNELYHTDVVNRYVFRVLNHFASHKSVLLNRAILKKMYAYMKKDSSLKLSSLKKSKIPSYILYLIGSSRLSLLVYKCSGALTSYMRKG